MSALPDAPRWSFWRRTYATCTLAGGFIVIGLGLLPSSDARAGALIDAGGLIVMTALVSVIGGAGLERGASWLASARAKAGS